MVLGTGEGIGRQIAHALRANGARLVCVDINKAQAERVAKEVSGISMVADVTVRDDLERVLTHAEAELSGIDGVVDIIGGFRPARDSELSSDYWNWTFNLNLMHAVHVVELGGPVLARAGGGTIAFVASALAFRARVEQTAYGAAKAALVSLVRSAAIQFGPAGIRVNAVAPGLTATPQRLRAWGADADRRMAAAAKALPTQRVNSTADVAGVLLFLSSDLSHNISGQTIIIDGGASVS